MPRDRGKARAAASFTALAAVAVAATATAGAARAAACPPAPSGTSVTFGYKGSKPQPFRVPDGVTQLYISAQGGHGGQQSTTHFGGAAGGIEAIMPSVPGACLNVWVGRHGTGNGGSGWRHGGAGGTNIGQGHNGAGGGGASAVTLPTDPNKPRLVAAGGGGAGGDGFSPAPFHDYAGGGGGDGGNPPGNGHDGAHATGGIHGVGGGSPYDNGQNGEGDGATATDMGEGGGGGAGFAGGSGGFGGDEAFGSDNAGGGGGAGGGQSALGDTAATLISYYRVQGCPYKHPYYRHECDGSVFIGWTTPAALAPVMPGKSTPLFPATALVHLIPVKPSDLVSAGARLPLVVTPVSPNGPPVRGSSSSSSAAAPEGSTPSAVRVRVLHHCGSGEKGVANATVTPSTSKAKRLKPVLSDSARKRIRKCASRSTRAPNHVHLTIESTQGGRTITEEHHLYE